MDNQNYIPEEEAYLRMLDREVPDLWGRIEAGLDREEGRTPSREERFLAEQQNIVPFEAGTQRMSERSGKNGKSRKKVWIIAGTAAAALILLASIAIAGIAGGRQSKRDKNAAFDMELSTKEVKNNDVMEIFTEAADETSGGTAKSSSGQNGQQSRAEQAMDAIDNESAASNEAMATEDTVPATLGGDGTDEDRDRGKYGESELTPGTVFLKPQIGQVLTIRALAESLEAGELARIYRTVDGSVQAFRISRINYEGDVEVLPDYMADLVDTTAEYNEVVITIKGDTIVQARKDVVDGEVVYYIP